MPVLRVKVVIVGDSKVGKSALTAMFHNSSNAFPKQYLMTLGVDFCVKSIDIPDSDDYSVELYLFDTSGNDIYETTRGDYWTGADAVIAVYDRANRASFDHVAGWVDEVHKALGGNSKAKLAGLIVGTKSDLDEYTEVSKSDVKALAEKYKFGSFECSAMNGTNVDAPFNAIANNTYQQYMQTAKKLAGKN